MINGSKRISNRHWKNKEKALNLRKAGWSYAEIMKKVPVAKSTISVWCRYVPLTRLQRKRLQEKRPQSMKGIETIQTNFWDKRCKAFHDGVRMFHENKKSLFFIGGLMLYWAEGNKQKASGFANSDPRTIKYMTKWFCQFFKLTPGEISLHLHLHSGQNEKKMKKYWSRITGVPLKNFYKSFIKPEGSGYRKNILYNGTVKLRINGASTYALYRIFGSLSEYLRESIDDKSTIEDWVPRLPYVKKSWVASTTG